VAAFKNVTFEVKEMIVEIKYLGVLASLTRKGAMQVKLPEGSTIEGMFDVIIDQEKLADPVVKELKLAVILLNKTKVDKATVLQDGDEVMVLNTIGGG
jgi:molybdopterin converting factor small subunit